MLAQGPVKILWPLDQLPNNPVSEDLPDLLLIREVGGPYVGRHHLVGHLRSSKRAEVAGQGRNTALLGKDNGLRTQDGARRVEHDGGGNGTFT